MAKQNYESCAWMNPQITAAFTIENALLCEIAGCENEAETIRRPGMHSGAYCRKHFDEIYYGPEKVPRIVMSSGFLESD